MDTFLIQKFWVTEKSSRLNEGGTYVFIVKPTATKNEVKKAVKQLYSVDATDVRMIRMPNKVKRFRNRLSEKRGMKKAMVTLKKGQKIDIGV